MPADDYKTFSLRVPVRVFERIEQNALREADGNRNQYVLSYLPECYDLDQAQTQNHTNAAPTKHR